jgi:hypothetical protein
MFSPIFAFLSFSFSLLLLISVLHNSFFNLTFLLVVLFDLHWRKYNLILSGVATMLRNIRCASEALSSLSSTALVHRSVYAFTCCVNDNSRAFPSRFSSCFEYPAFEAKESSADFHNVTTAAASFRMSPHPTSGNLKQHTLDP